MDMQRRAEMQERLHRALDLPMVLLALALIPVLLLPVVIEVDAGTVAWLDAVEWMIWAAFAFELGANTYLAERRGRYLVEHWFDVLIVALPFLRPLRLARSARLFRLLRATRLISVGVRFAHGLRAVLGRHGLQYVVVTTLVLVVACAGAVTYFERGGGGTIGDSPDRSVVGNDYRDDRGIWRYVSGDS